jgi:hypothetical protein
MTTKKQKSKPLTLGEYKRRKKNGTVSEKDHAEVDAAVAKVRKMAAQISAQIKAWDDEAEALLRAAGDDATIPEMENYLRGNPPSAGAIASLIVIVRKKLHQETAKKGGDAKAAKLKEPKKEICLIWASGKYSTRETCADEEWNAIGFGSKDTARQALINTPNPSPWPAREQSKKR